MTFDEWLQTQPVDQHEALKIAFGYGRIAGLDTAKQIIDGSLKNGTV